jgi:uncharacterized LabA/DUF88 family protein
MELKQVRIYSGIPSATRDPRKYSAYRRQEPHWKKQGVEVVSRPLRYPYNWPKLPAEQKGVDVSLAVDFVVLAIEGTFDVGVIASTDTDLRPAIEFVAGRRGLPVEVCSWRTASFRKELPVPGIRIWCHRLAKSDYDQVADDTDYNL